MALSRRCAPGSRKFPRRPGDSRASQSYFVSGPPVAKKSPELLLQAFSQLPASLGDNTLMLVFAGPDEGGIQQKLALEASRLQLSQRVKFSGPLFDQAKWAAYRDADVFVLPSQNENFGNTAAEAIAAGTPVVVTEQCGIAPLLKDVAGLVVTHNAAALAGALQRLLSDSQLHGQFAAACPVLTSQSRLGTTRLRNGKSVFTYD